MDQESCLKGLKEVEEVEKEPLNLEDFFIEKFGIGFTDLFMRPYNEKIWSTELN